MSLAIQPSDSGVVFDVHAKIRASRAAVLGIEEGVLQVAIAAPPVDGAANRALCAFIAKALGVAKTRVQLVRGARHRRKRLLVVGLSAVEVRAALECQ